MQTLKPAKRFEVPETLPSELCVSFGVLDKKSSINEMEGSTSLDYRLYFETKDVKLPTVNRNIINQKRVIRNYNIGDVQGFYNQLSAEASLANIENACKNYGEPISDTQLQIFRMQEGVRSMKIESYANIKLKQLSSNNKGGKNFKDGRETEPVTTSLFPPDAQPKIFYKN